MSSITSIGSGPLCAAHAPYAHGITPEQISSWRMTIKQYLVPGTTQSSRCVLCVLHCFALASSAVGLPKHYEQSQVLQEQNPTHTTSTFPSQPWLKEPQDPCIMDVSGRIYSPNISSDHINPAYRGVSPSAISSHFPQLRDYNDQSSGSGRVLQRMPSPTLSEHSFRYPFPGSGTSSQAIECTFMLTVCCTGFSTR